MDLVPYSSRDSREIVLQHDDAIVLRDPQSKQLILRGASTTSKLTECPYCHQSLPTAPEHEPRAARRQESYVSPEYFRMLDTSGSASATRDRARPSSPIRRLVQPAFGSESGASIDGSTGEFVASSPADTRPVESQGIRREAFSPNYFRKFFIEERELGRGGKGVVLLVRHELDGVFLGHFACKRVPVGDDHAWLEKVLIEVQLLQRLSHPNLVSYRHVWLEDSQLNRFGPSVPCAFILQQYCNSGDLLHYIIGTGSIMSTNEQLKEQLRRRSKGHSERPADLKSHQRRLAFEEIYSFFKDITSGLAHLHAANYIHRDLKPSNCLLHTSESGLRCLISDFGEVQAVNVIRKNTGATGTISYCAPEVLRQDSSGRYGNFTAKSDIFSLGMILYFMCFSRLPYSSAENIQEEFEDLDQLRAEISTWSGFQEERQERPDLPDQLYSFLKRLLALNPLDRPSATEILQAISTGTGLDAPNLGRRNSNINVSKRIQPIDSPAPGTPVPGQRSRSAAYIEDDGDISIKSSSAESSLPHIKADSEPRKFLSEGRDRSPGPGPLTPLLMPPPSTRLTTFRNRADVLKHRAYHFALLNRRLILGTLRLVIFLVKVYTLAKPCLPYATNPIIGVSLLLLAAYDLGQGVSMEWRVTTALMMAHFVVLGVARRQGVLCARNEDLWRDEWP